MLLALAQLIFAQLVVGNVIGDQPITTWGTICILQTDSTLGSEITWGIGLQDGTWRLVFQPYLKTKGYPEYPDKYWNDGFLAGDFRRAYLNYSYRSDLIEADFRLGRDSIQVGPTGLFLNSNGTYLDMFTISARTRFLWDVEMVWGTTILDPVDSNNRYLSFHGLEFHPPSRANIRLGWAESIIYGGYEVTPLPYYLNPLAFYYSYQEFYRSSRRVYTNVGWDLWIGTTISGAELLGELFIDDYPYVDEYNEKGKLAWNVQISQKTTNWSWSWKYRGATRWTYTHDGGFSGYFNFNRPLGDSIGCDFDLLSFESSLTKRDLKLWFMAGIVRKGEGTIFERPPSGWWPDEYFLTGVVEKKVEIGLGFQKSLFDGKAVLTVKAIPGYVMNCGHVKGQDKFKFNGLVQIEFRPS